MKETIKKNIIDLQQETTLVKVGNRKMTVQEVKPIVERHFSNQQSIREDEKTLIEGRWFEVNPQAIDWQVFFEKREDEAQEMTRQLILEAFSEWKSETNNYGLTFKTMIPVKTWVRAKPDQLQKIAQKIGDDMASWVEQALEWAQRIHNGETWESICNSPDRFMYCRLIKWKEGLANVGGYIRGNDCRPDRIRPLKKELLSFQHDYNVPLVVKYK